MQELLYIILFPVLGFAFSGLAGKFLPKPVLGWISSLTILASFILSVIVFQHVAHHPEGTFLKLFNFLSVGDLQVDFSIQADRLTSMMMLIVTGVGFLIHVYSIAYMKDDPGFYKFFSYLNLFIFNMLMLIMGSNFLMLFFGWEGVGLCSYLLIGFWYGNVEYGKAARKAFVMNRIGDLGLLLGMFLIVWQFKSLDYKIVFDRVLAMEYDHFTLNAICVLLFIGAIGKSAQIPLFTWLPDAMAGPTPVSALIHAATMVTAGVYLVVRCQSLYYFSPMARDLILFIGLSTSIMAALIGLKQNDIKKVLAYSTVSQLGLMFVALGCGAYTAAMFHVTTHAFFKALLFLGSGSVIHAMGGEQDIRRMGGLRKYLPITYVTFLIGTLAISGFPFLAGFFSKDEILVSTFMRSPIIWVLAIASAALTAFYMFRMFFVTFHGNFRGTEDQKHHLHESPLLMTMPLMILAVLSVVGGALNLPTYLGSSSEKMHHWLAPLKTMGPDPAPVAHMTEFVLAGLAVAMFVLAWFFMRRKYVTQNTVPEEDVAMQGSGKVLANKMYVDDAYDIGFTEPVNRGSDLLDKLEAGVDKGLSGGASALTQKLSSWLGRLQNGNIEYYLVYMVLGLLLIIGLNLLI